MSATVEKKDFDFTVLDNFINELPSKNGSLITVLHKAQDIFGYLPIRVQNHIAHKLHIPSSKVFGVVTFYSLFTMEPKGKYNIKVCMGTACFVRGSEDILEEFSNQLGIESGNVSVNQEFGLDAIRCVGACGLAPVVSVNDRVFGRVTRDDVVKIVNDIKGGVFDEQD